MIPLVSVVTPTWDRRDIVLHRCIPSVASQTYPNIEHIVVSDGPDPELYELVPTSVRYAELSHHDDTARWGHHARLAGIGLANGELIAYLDDDNAYRPEHIESLVEALTVYAEASFAYSQMMVHGPWPTYIVGCEPPAYGQIDTSLLLHRRELLDKETWKPSLPTIDWDIVRRWLENGARWVFVNRITLDYYR